MTRPRSVHGVAVVGCGNMGAAHASAVAASRRARLIAAVDTRLETARAVAERYGTEFHSADFRDLLTRSDIDVVVVATYPSTHAEIAIACMRAGKHVLLEKPIAPTMEAAEAAVRVACETDRKLRIGYVLRHNKTYQRAAKLVRSGILGSPLVMRMMGGEHIMTEAHWQQDFALLTETSPIVDCGCHYVDVMRWLTGAEAIRVSGSGCRLDPAIPEGCYDYGVIAISFSDGSSGVYEVGWARAYRSFSEKEFIGPRGRLRIIYASERPEHHEEGDLLELYQPPGRYRYVNVSGDLKRLGAEFADLLDCIDRDLDPMPALEDAMKSLQIVLAGHHAILTGAAVSVTPWESARLG